MLYYAKMTQVLGWPCALHGARAETSSTSNLGHCRSPSIFMASPLEKYFEAKVVSYTDLTDVGGYPRLNRTHASELM